ncbi:MAG TPA: lysophospholipid acyltransferase family protein, partial [Gammaproteobacteria bacterium]|nr:lysophospholipid acyltransferase family protein [Gammaproteobacteria bacterium]
MIRIIKGLVMLVCFSIMTILFITPALLVLMYKRYISYQQGEWLVRHMRYLFVRMHDRIFWHPSRFEVIWRTPKVSPAQTSALMISNHQCFLDSHFLITLAQASLGDQKFLMKDSIKWIPFWGWYTWLNNYPFIKNNNRVNRFRKAFVSDLYQKIKEESVRSQALPTMWTCYPEGTRYKQNKDQHNKGVLSPRVGGVKTLLTMFDKPVVCWDITLKYHPKPPSYFDVLFGKGYSLEVWAESHQL